MTNGTGGGFPTNGDEPDEGARSTAEDRTTVPEGSSDPDTEGVEIVDDGADWLATQLAALPVDTTDIPIVTDSDDRSSADADADVDAGTGSSDGAPDDVSGTAATSGTDSTSRTDSTSGTDAPATRRLPVLSDEAASSPVSARASDPAPTADAAPDTASEPPLTRPRAPEPMPGWFAPSSPPPPRPPLPTQAESVVGDDVDDDDADEDDADVAAGHSAADRAVAETRAGDGSTPNEQDTTDASAGDGEASEVDGAPERDAAAPVSARSHPNAIVLPGLPKRASGAAESGSVESGSAESEPAESDSVASGPAESDSAIPGAVAPAAPAPRSGIPEDSGEIDFGNFAWSLVANDEDDPRVVRERRDAEERAAAEAESARLAAEAAAASAAVGAAAPSVAPGPAAVEDDDEPNGSDDAQHDSDPASSDGSAPRESAPGATAAGFPASGSEAPPAAAGQAELPSWSRPDLDDAFPATAAMDALPADDDPDDPDDELDAADRFSALGTAAMPVSAASAAVGAADHSPAPSVRSRNDSSESVFPDGLVAESDAQMSPGHSGREGSGQRAAGRGQSVGGSVGRRGSLPLVAAGVVIVLALVGLFYLGTRLPLIFAGSSGAAASATPTPTATPEPTAEQPASGPLAPGTYAWDELRGGECLDPYSSPWAEEFTVVDCSQPHAGQLVFAAPYTDDPADPFPGEDVIAAEIGLLCSAPGVVDFGAAGAFTDLQIQGAYPVSGEQWAAGNRDYFCFASRSSGEPLTTSVATP